METIIHKDVFVCFLDVLGFRDLINNNSHDILDRIFDSKIISLFNLLAENEIERNNKEKVNFLSVSDSLILWTNNTSENSLFRLVNNTKYVMLSCFNHGIPLRGAISRGPISVKNHNNQTIIVGKALTNAYELESKQEWSGCVIDDACIINTSVYEYLNENYFICDYQVPFKNGPVRNLNVIDWINDYSFKELNKHNKLNEQKIKESFARHNKNVDDWGVKNKIDNTINFFLKAYSK